MYKLIDRVLNKTGLLEKTLDATMLRNNAITQNIANVDTPNYKRKKVDFEEMLGAAMENSPIDGFRTDPRHIPIGGQALEQTDIKITEDQSFNDMRLDGNNVDIDAEMSLLAKNTLRYNMLVQKLNGQFRKIKSAISEGRK